MCETVRAIYENQVLRLLEPLDLKNGQQVQIEVMAVEPADEPHAIKEELSPYVALAAQESDVGQEQPGSTAEARSSIEALVQKLIREGRMRPRPPGPVPPPPLSEAELLALADKLGSVPGKTTSEMVIEDRGDRV